MLRCTSCGYEFLSAQLERVDDTTLLCGGEGCRMLLTYRKEKAQELQIYEHDMARLNALMQSAEMALSNAVEALSVTEGNIRHSCACASKLRPCKACKRQVAATPEAHAVPKYRDSLANVERYVRDRRPPHPIGETHS